MIVRGLNGVPKKFNNKSDVFYLFYCILSALFLGDTGT